jgi:uncharacterized membrane protein YdjX (TVP38/TMEM64 family)
MENTSPRQIVFSLLALALILGGLYFFFRVFDIEAVHARIEEAGVWAPLILIAAKATTIVLAPLSGGPLYPIGGALFGFWKALALLVLGDMLGGSIAFFLSRLFGRGLAERLLGGQHNFVSEALAMMSSAKGFFLARLGFITFPEIPAYAAGLSRIPYPTFIVIFTLVDIPPSALAAGLGSLLVGGESGLVFISVFFLGSFVSAISIFLFYRLLRQRVDNSQIPPGAELH